MEELLTKLREMLNDGYLTIDEAADYLKVKKNTLYKYTSQRKIPYYKPEGKQVKFKKTELDKWMNQFRVSSQDELNETAERYV